MNFNFLKIEILDNISILNISKPQTLNALDNDLLSELDKAIDYIKQLEDVRVLIITGEGKSFVAGADIAQMSTMNTIEAKAFGEFGSRVFRKIELLPIPVIAAINGYALGGGCELALACDIRIASSKAKIGQLEVGLGITPGFSGTQRLPRLVGEGKAKELIYTARAIDAAEALSIGLINQISEPEKLMDATINMAKTIAKKAPIAIRLSKESIENGRELDIESAIKVENNLFAICFATKDQKEGMKAFLQKKEVVWNNE